MSERRFNPHEDDAAQTSVVGQEARAVMAPTLALRHVAFSPGWGVYLGPKEDGYGVWSLKDVHFIKPGATAPTFANKEDFKANLKGPAPSNVRLVEIFPTGPDETATSEDCERRTLPGWAR